MHMVKLKRKLHAKNQYQAIFGNQLKILGLLRERGVLVKKRP